MKKFFFLVMAVCLLFVSCNQKAETTETQAPEVVAEECAQKHDHGCCSMTEEQKAMFAQWNQFETLDAETQTQVIASMKAFIDAEMQKCAEKGACHKEGDKAEGCCKDKAEGKECCKSKTEGQEGCCKDKAEGQKCDKSACESKKADCAAMKEKWNNFDNLTMEEQKALIDQILEKKRAHHHAKKSCGSHEGCGNHEGHNHEGCGNHEGCSKK